MYIPRNSVTQNGFHCPSLNAKLDNFLSFALEN